MTNSRNNISLRTAALIAGIAYIMMLSTSFAEFYVDPKLIVPGNVAETLKNITADQSLLRYGIVAYLVNFMGDILAAWALYILLKPVNEKLSLLTALFRLLYTIIGLIALLNLVTVLRLTDTTGDMTMLKPDQVLAQATLCLSAFRSEWSFGYIFFGIHLGLLGYLVFRSHYIPRVMGVLLFVAGAGWLTDNLRPLLFPHFSINFIIILIAGLGEIVFMFWLLIRGYSIKELEQPV